MQRRAPRKLGRWLVAALAAPVLIALYLLALPIVLVVVVASRIRWMTYCRRHHGEEYLIASPRRGWREFIVNNVASELPSDLPLLWHSGRAPGEAQKPNTVLEWLRLGEPIGPKPLLVLVTRSGFRVTRLHSELLPLKRSTRKRDDAIRRQVREILQTLTA